MNANPIGTWWIGAMLLGPVVFSGIQQASDLSSVTVPAGRLPAGCALEPVDPPPRPTSGQVATLPGQPGASANPWIGSDRRTAAAIRREIDGVPDVPDAAPLDRKAAQAYALKWADNIVQAYRASYRAQDALVIDVAAVRFNDPALAQPTPPPGMKDLRRGIKSRMVIGSSVVVVFSAATSPCFAAIESYVRSLQ